MIDSQIQINKKIDDIISSYKQGKIDLAKEKFNSILSCESIFGLIGTDFVYYLPIENESKVLEIRSGFGQSTFVLTKFSSRVTSVDTNSRNIEFCKIRNEFTGTNANLKYVDEMCNLESVLDGEYDVIVMHDYDVIKDEKTKKVLHDRLKLGGSMFVNNARPGLVSNNLSRKPSRILSYITLPNYNIQRIIVPMHDNTAIDFAFRLLLSEHQILKRIYQMFGFKVFVPWVKYLIGGRFVIIKK